MINLAPISENVLANRIMCRLLQLSKMLAKLDFYRCNELMYFKIE